jgi:hypothetical protein
MFPNASPDALASVYIDVSNLICSMYSGSEFVSYFRMELAYWCEEFLKSYEQESGHRLDRATALATAAHSMAAYQHYVFSQKSARSLREWRVRRFRLLRVRLLYESALKHLRRDGG